MAVECIWIKRGNCLVPADGVTEKVLAQTKDLAQVTTSAPRSRRNPEDHKLMMKLLQIVVDNTNEYADIEDLMFDLKMRSKMYHSAIIDGGRVAIYPKSISFAAMGQEQFKRVCDRWLYLITTEIMPGADPVALLDEAREP